MGVDRRLFPRGTGGKLAFTSPAPPPPALTAAIVGPGDPYAQTVQALQNIDTALRAAGASMSHVVRTRMFVTDIDQWSEIGRAHGEVFGSIRPAATMVEVRRLISPEMLVEIEAEAVLP